MTFYLKYFPILWIFNKIQGTYFTALCSLITVMAVDFFFNLCGGTLGTAATTGLLYQPRVIGDGDYGEIGGMKMAIDSC
jgi:hypothetical protein